MPLTSCLPYCTVNNSCPNAPTLSGFLYLYIVHSTPHFAFALPILPCITQRPITLQAVPPDTIIMPATTTQYTFPTPNGKLEDPRKWLQRQLRKTTSRQTIVCDEDNDESLKRPRTAPSTEFVPSAESPPAVPSIWINIEQASPHPSIPPLRPPRPDSSIIRDVNAWLDASMDTPSPPLMNGLAYWREATSPRVKDSIDIQHAIPIVRKSGVNRPSISRSQQMRSIRRCAKRLHVQMPILLRTKSQRPMGRKQINRRSVSMPLLALPYEEMRQATPPKLFCQSGTLEPPGTRPFKANERVHANVLMTSSRPSAEYFNRCLPTPASARRGGLESSLERRVNAFFVRSLRSADSTRSSTAAAGPSREDSMGDLSDVPTYSSGLPPPSYRSRPASVLTTSSFGCIDGMNLAQRQDSQQRAALRRGVRGKLKRLAQNFAT